MDQVTPFKNSREAILSLDNGGRFFNFLTKADDGKISKAELAKVAGLFHDKQKMILFLDISLSTMDIGKNKIIASLDSDLKLLYDKYKPMEILPSEVYTKGEIATNTIINGIPKLIDSKEEFEGFIMIPIMIGSVMTMAMIPLIDQYDIYEIREESSSNHFIIAHAKSKKKLPERLMKVGGILKELKADKKEKKASKLFLETTYYLEE